MGSQRLALSNKLRALYMHAHTVTSSCYLYQTNRGDFLVYLGGVSALHIGVLLRAHLQETHPERIYVHRLIIALLVHLRGHKFRSPWGREEGKIP